MLGFPDTPDENIMATVASTLRIADAARSMADPPNDVVWYPMDQAKNDVHDSGHHDHIDGHVGDEGDYARHGVSLNACNNGHEANVYEADNRLRQ